VLLASERDNEAKELAMMKSRNDRWIMVTAAGHLNPLIHKTLIPC
jgi:hypothetical protein